MNPIEQLEALADGETLNDRIKALATEPGLLEKLAEMRSHQDRLSSLAGKIDALRDAQEDATAEMRRVYRKAHADTFKDVDWKRALVGGTTFHNVTLAEVANYKFMVPSGRTAHESRKFVTDHKNPLAPIAEHEAILMQWLVGVTLLGAENPVEQDLSAKDPSVRLTLIRQLPFNLADRLAQECIDLQTWLNVVLEDEMGNS